MSTTDLKSYWVKAGVCACLGAWLVAGDLGCTSSDESTGFVVKVENYSAAAPAPEFLLLNWYNPEKRVWKDIRIPESGDLVPEKDVLASIFIEVDPFNPGERRTFVTARKGKDIVAQGALANLVPEVGARTEVTLRLAEGALQDTDKDSVPDIVDNCPMEENSAQGPCLIMDASVPMKKDAAPVVDAAIEMDMGEIKDAGPPDMRTVDAPWGQEPLVIPMGNHVEDPGFEMGVGKWVQIGDGKDSGVKAPGRGGNGNALYATDPNGFWELSIPAFAVDADYRLTVYGKSTKGSCKAGVQVVGIAKQQLTNSFSTAAFTKNTLDFNIPANATGLRIQLLNDGDTVCIFDDIELRQMK